MSIPRFLRRHRNHAYLIPRLPAIEANEGNLLRYPHNPWSTSWYYWLRHLNDNTHPKLLTVVGPRGSRIFPDGSFGDVGIQGPEFKSTPLTSLYTKMLYFAKHPGHSDFGGNYLLHNCKVYLKRQMFTQYQMFDFGFCHSSKENNYNIVCQNCTYTVPPMYTMYLFDQDTLTLDLNAAGRLAHKYLSATDHWIDSRSLLPLSVFPKRK